MLSGAIALLLASGPGLSLIFGGDVIPHETLKGTDGGWRPMLEPISAQLRGADVAMVNLETPVVEVRRPERGPLVFHARPDLPKALAAAGVDVVTTANNHALDQHREGIVATRAAIADAGLLGVGADVNEARAWQPLVLDGGSFSVGLFAFTRFLNRFHNTRDAGAPHVPLVHYADDPSSGGLDEAQLLEQVAAAASQVDALIVVPHWGNEKAQVPRPDDVALARAMVSKGALAVIGHHPHVVQPIETLTTPDGREAVVAYSLGNLLSNQGRGAPQSPLRDGLLVRVLLQRAPGEPRVRLAEVGVTPVFTELRGRHAAVRVLAELPEAEHRARWARLRSMLGRWLGDERPSGGP